MTAPQDPPPPHDPDAAVRSRLAAARHTEPVPDHVVARLDAVLADLTAERRAPEPAPAAPVVPLSSAPARRRRALTTGLVAAAAVVVLGVALPRVVDSTDGSEDATSASTADRGSASEAGPAEDSDAGGGAAESAPSQLSEGPGAATSERSGSAYAAPVVLSSGEPLRPAVRPLARQDAATAYDASPACALDVGAGDRVDATWDGLPAVVVLRPAEAGRRVVEVYVCGTDEVVGSTTLAAR